VGALSPGLYVLAGGLYATGEAQAPYVLVLAKNIYPSRTRQTFIFVQSHINIKALTLQDCSPAPGHLIQKFIS